MLQRGGLAVATSTLLVGLCVGVSLLGGDRLDRRAAAPATAPSTRALLPLPQTASIGIQPPAELAGSAPVDWVTAGPAPPPDPKWTTGSPLPAPVVYSTETTDPVSFPVRPARARLHHATGTFIALGFGMHSGGVVIATRRNPNRWFYANGNELRLNGDPIPCWGSPSHDGRRFIEAYQCSKPWPKALVPGKTVVMLTYWAIPTTDGIEAEGTDRIWYDAK